MQGKRKWSIDARIAYETTALTLEEIAKKYNKCAVTVRKLSAAEKWTKNKSSATEIIQEIERIKKEIREELKVEKKAELTSYIENEEVLRQRVLYEMQRNAFFDVGKLKDSSGKLIPVHLLDEDTRRTISAIKVRKAYVGRGDEAEAVELLEIKTNCKTKNLELLGKHLGIFEKDNKQKQSVFMDFLESLKD